MFSIRLMKNIATHKHGLSLENRITYRGWWIVAIAAVAMVHRARPVCFRRPRSVHQAAGGRVRLGSRSNQSCCDLLHHFTGAQHPHHRSTGRSLWQQTGVIAFHSGLCRLARYAGPVCRLPVGITCYLYLDWLFGGRRERAALFAHHNNLVRQSSGTGNRDCYGGERDGFCLCASTGAVCH